MNTLAILGCGYVGTALAKSLQGSGRVITTTTTRADRLPDLATVSDRPLQVQGNDPAGLKMLLTGQTTLLVSVAAQGKDYRSSYLATAQTLGEVIPEFPQLQQVIYTSSYSVYGDQGGQWVDEATAVQPGTANTQILAETEEIFLNLPVPKVCVLRLGGIYGPGRELERIFSRAAGKTRPGAGLEWSNWIHLTDIVGAIAFAQAHQLGGIYNVIQDEILPLRDLIAQVCDRHHLAPVQWDSSQGSDRKTNVRCRNQKLKAAGYTFKHPQFWSAP